MIYSFDDWSRFSLLQSSRQKKVIALDYIRFSNFYLWNKKTTSYSPIPQAATDSTISQNKLFWTVFPWIIFLTTFDKFYKSCLFICYCFICQKQYDLLKDYWKFKILSFRICCLIRKSSSIFQGPGNRLFQ